MPIDRKDSLTQQARRVPIQTDGEIRDRVKACTDLLRETLERAVYVKFDGTIAVEVKAQNGRVCDRTLIVRDYKPWLEKTKELSDDEPK